MRKSKSNIDAFLSLSNAEKEATVREFDREFIGEQFGPLSSRQRKAWNRARQRMNQNRSIPVKRISLIVPLELLSRSDAMAKKVGASRSDLIARGLKAVLAGKA
jgi:hypothetical protein